MWPQKTNKNIFFQLKAVPDSKADEFTSVVLHKENTLFREKLQEFKHNPQKKIGIAARATRSIKFATKQTTEVGQPYFSVLASPLPRHSTAQ